MALNDIKNGRVKSIRGAAKLYEIPHTTLAGRINGIEARVDKQPNGRKQTQYEEDSLVEWILSIDTRGARPATVGEMANIIKAAVK